MEEFEISNVASWRIFNPSPRIRLWRSSALYYYHPWSELMLLKHWILLKLDSLNFAVKMIGASIIPCQIPGPGTRWEWLSWIRLMECPISYLAIFPRVEHHEKEYCIPQTPRQRNWAITSELMTDYYVFTKVIKFFLWSGGRLSTCRAYLTTRLANVA